MSICAGGSYVEVAVGRSQAGQVDSSGSPRSWRVQRVQ